MTAYPRAVAQPDDHGHATLALVTVPPAADVANYVIQGRVRETSKHDLRHRTHPSHGHTDRRPDDADFTQWCIDHPAPIAYTTAVDLNLDGTLEVIAGSEVLDANGLRLFSLSTCEFESAA